MGKKIFKKVGKLIGKIEQFDPFASSINSVLGVDSSIEAGQNIADQYLGTDLSGAKAEARQLARDAQSRQEALLEQLKNQAASANVDLGLDNTVQVEVGGSAAAQAGNTTRRKRTGPGGVASSLGINA